MTKTIALPTTDDGVNWDAPERDIDIDTLVELTQHILAIYKEWYDVTIGETKKEVKEFYTLLLTPVQFDGKSATHTVLVGDPDSTLFSVVDTVWGEMETIIEPGGSDGTALVNFFAIEAAVEAAAR